MSPALGESVKELSDTRKSPKEMGTRIPSTSRYMEGTFVSPRLPYNQQGPAAKDLGKRTNVQEYSVPTAKPTRGISPNLKEVSPDTEVRAQSAKEPG